MKTHNLQTGALGEQFAKEYLEKNGYKVVDQNYKTKYAEIDLIAEKGKELIFVEVRTKTGEQFGTPEETIDYKKRAKLMRNARSYVARKKFKGLYQIDAICIIIDSAQRIQRLSHYQSITS